MALRRLIATTTLLAATVLAAGCDDPAEPGFTPPNDPLGVVVIPAGNAIQVGYWGVLTGPEVALGDDPKRGVEIALDDRDAELLGHSLALGSEEALCSADGGMAAAMALAEDSSLVGLVGPSCSSEAVGGMATLSAAGLTTISPATTNPTFTDPDYRGSGGELEETFAGYLRTAHSDAIQGEVAAQFAYNELGLRTAATIHDGTSYPEGLQQVFADAFQELGGTITAVQVVDDSDEDMGPALAPLAEDPPDMIYLPLYVSAGARVVSQARETDGLEDVALMGADATFAPAFVAQAGAAAMGVYLSSTDAGAFTGPYDEFLQKYEAKYGGEPVGPFDAHAYDAANILFEAIERAAVTGPDGTLYVGRQALRDEAFATSGHEGVIGTLSCDSFGDCSLPHIAVFEVTMREVNGAWPPEEPIWRPNTDD